MKIIDLLNKIANGEEVPNKIIAGDSETEYYFDKELKDYISTRYQEKLFEDEIGKFLKYYINDEVEIIEEEKEIPEKLETYKEIDDEEHYANILKVSKNGECEIDEAASVIVDKVNEIIDYLKSKGDE